MSCSPTLLAMALAALPRLAWPFRVLQRTVQCTTEASFERFLKQLEDDTRVDEEMLDTASYIRNTYQGSLAGVCTFVYNSYKAKGYGPEKTSVVEFLTGADVFVFDLDSCKVCNQS